MARQKLEGAPEVDEDDDVSAAAGAQFENNEDGLVVNLAEVEELKFENLPPNTYDIIVEDCQYGKSKSSNQPKWELKLSVVGGEYNGRKLFDTFSWSPKALSGTKTRLAVIAPELASNSNLVINNPEVVASIIGRRARVKVVIEKSDNAEYDDRNRIKRWYQPTGDAAFV
jgi:hypothetical protein